jgi:hypothetical protein
VLYTENETNRQRFGWGNNTSLYVKDGINEYVLHDQTEAVNRRSGTKASPYYNLNVAPGETKVIRLRLSDNGNLSDPLASDFETIFQVRKQEADEFYQAVNPFPISDDMRNVQKQAFAGMLWSKQFYYYVVHDWLKGDSAGPKPPDERKAKGARNVNWMHLFNEDILSMPDKWEYPWFAAWDLAFHATTFALIDPIFAKDQLRFITREWYMHPNGQMPAYEWNLEMLTHQSSLGCMAVYKMKRKCLEQLIEVSWKKYFRTVSLLYWWTNRKDPDGEDIFGGGFLGLDNIGPIDRSSLSSGESIDQADGTAWMAMYCLNMLEISLELATGDPAYEITASKFFQHFLLIADAMNKIGGTNVDIWDSNQQFYRDILKVDGQTIPMMSAQ